MKKGWPSANPFLLAHVSESASPNLLSLYLVRDCIELSNTTRYQKK